MTPADISALVAGWNAPVFTGNVDDDVKLWLSTICRGLKQRRIPSEHWVSVALHFMDDEPRGVLDGVQKMMRKLEGRNWDWDWDKFTCALIHIQEQMKKDASENTSIGDALLRFRREHPYAATAASLGLVTVGGITVAPAILVGTLNLLGFSATGVVGGSIAASIQSAVYGGAVASGSLFSLAQSAAAGGVVVASVAGQAVSASVIGFGAWLLGQSGNDDHPDDPDDHAGESAHQSGNNDHRSTSTVPTAPPAISHIDLTTVAVTATVRNAQQGTGVDIGPMNWGKDISGEVHGLIARMPRANTIDAEAVRAVYAKPFPKNDKFVTAFFPTNVAAIQFVNAWASGHPPGFEKTSVSFASGN
ncbi:hypothetical protein DFH07DRAFT_970874 [Mycena maculata]|uniref:Uncharacterized protein n=1 Tax=Mycena maculata TaxID=230809 RepID=A0AAD7MNR1_9AGAR|nr:hypothetical protein DFH07DRAFT_970874 [Mycena maculata]